jgi:hypothetical protein
MLQLTIHFLLLWNQHKHLTHYSLFVAMVLYKLIIMIKKFQCSSVFKCCCTALLTFAKTILQPAQLLLLLLPRAAVVACWAELGPLLLRVRLLHFKVQQMQYIHGLISNCTCISGMAFGTGSAVAHRAVDAVMGPRTIQHETVVSEAASSMTPMGNTAGSDKCDNPSKAFQDVCSLLPSLI